MTSPRVNYIKWRKKMNIITNKKTKYTTIPHCMSRRPTVSVFAKAVYMFIKSLNPSFPGYTKIQEATGIRSRTTVSRCLNELEVHNFIYRLKNTDKRSNQYRFVDHEMDNGSSSNGLKSVHQMDSNKNNVIIPNNKMVSSPIQASEETLIKTQEILSESLKSLGPDAGINYKEKNRPSFNPNHLGE